MTASSWIFVSMTVLSGVGVGGAAGYLLLLTSAAAYRLRRTSAVNMPVDRAAPGFGKVTIIVPAHDEEAGIATTLQSLRSQDYPAHRYDIVVVADNCTDHTAAIARDGGATVWERTDTDRRGKGFALAWAIDRLLALPKPADAFVIVDADTRAEPDFLRQLVLSMAEHRDPAGRAVVQGRYGVLNAGEGWRAGLMAAAFDLCNHIRPLGGECLGLSADLKGNGMGFTREVFAAAPWSGQSITEDLDYGLDLLQHHGITVGYAADARVFSEMPTVAAQAGSQRDRWENGRRLIVQRRALPLLAAGLARGDIRLFEAGVRLLLPPLAELFALCLGWAIAVMVETAFRLLPGASGIWIAVALIPLVSIVVYILAGIRVAGATPAAYGALCYAPVYALWKFARILTNRGSQEWVRTPRTPVREIK